MPQLQQHPADENAYGQRAHIAKKEPRDGLVEGREAEKGAAEASSHENFDGRAAHDAEARKEGGDRHHLGDGDPIQPIHEVDEVHEPHAAEYENGKLHALRNPMREGSVCICRHNDCSHRHDLKQQAVHGGQGANVVNGTHNGQSDSSEQTQHPDEAEIDFAAPKVQLDASGAMIKASTVIGMIVAARTAMPPP